MTRTPRPVVQALIVVSVLVLAELPLAWHYLVSWPGDQWQVDVEVYREAARSLVYGRPIYEQLTEAPQLLPFTYPPFAAIISLPMALLPFHVLGWVWTGLQVAATYATVMIAFRRLLARVGAWRWVAGSLLTVPLLYLLPVSDGVRFGQVNAFLVLACLADLALPVGRWHRLRGVWIGLATAVKLDARGVLRALRGLPPLARAGRRGGRCGRRHDRCGAGAAGRVRWPSGAAR